MEHFAPGRGKLKVTGILYIIFGVLSLLGALLLLAGGSLLLDAGRGSAEEMTLGTLAALFSLLAFVDAALYLALGVLGVKNCDKPEKCGVNFVLAIVVLVLVIIGMAANLFAGGLSDAASSIIGLVLAIFYLIGAKENKDAAKQ